MQWMVDEFICYNTDHNEDSSMKTDQNVEITLIL